MRDISNLSTQERIEALLKDNQPTTDVKSVTYTAGGDGATGALTLFTVTGQIKVVSLLPFTKTTLTETAGTVTIALGTADNTSLFIAASEPEDMIAGDFWTQVAPVVKSIIIPAALKDVAVSEDIIATIATSTISAGVHDFYLSWIPLSSDAAVVIG